MKRLKDKLSAANGTAERRYGERVNALLRER